MTAALLAAWLLLTAHPQPCSPSLSAAIEHVESRGRTLAVSGAGARGLWQVMPAWSRVPAWALHVPAVGRWEGCRILRVWRRRARARCAWERAERYKRRCVPLVRALAAYNAGKPGLRGRSTAAHKYACDVLARVNRRSYRQARNQCR